MNLKQLIEKCGSRFSQLLYNHTWGETFPEKTWIAKEIYYTDKPSAEGYGRTPEDAVEDLLRQLI